MTAEHPADMPFRLGQYEPLLELASGGMAVVYVARQLGAAGFERIVVVKRVHRHLLAQREFIDMFKDEARVASTIRHPNVVPVSDVVLADDKELFLVMEYVEGVALSTLRRLHKAPFDPKIAVRIAIDVLAGLGAAHDAKDMRGEPLDVVHRDVSPHNVLVSTDGSARIIDFGVAKARHRLTETRSGSLKGKYAYMAPEQARGQEVDRRTDIFAAGVVLYEMLAGKRLFRGDNEIDTLRRIVDAPIEPPSQYNPAVTPALDAVVLHALERDPPARYQTCHEMIVALESACAPATPRDVAALLETYCKDRLAERRNAIQSMLEGRARPLSIVVGRDGDDASVQLSGATGGTEGKLSVMQDASLARQAGAGKRWVVPAALGLVGLVAVGALVAIVSAGNQKQPSSASTTAASGAGAATAATTPTSPVTNAGAPTTTAAPSNEVAITVVADAPIENVSAPGLKRVELDGLMAHLAVTKFTGDLKVEGTLKGGKHVAATVHQGDEQAKLAPAPKSVVPNVVVVPNTTSIAAPTGTKKTGELQGNPYGE